MTGIPSAHAVQQYATTTGNLAARIALHRYTTNPRTWFSFLDERLPLAGRVLEVGAGTGELWKHVDHAARGTDLTLTDFSPAMCARLRGVPGARVCRCDAARLPFRDASCDTVIANHMLYHLDDVDAALSEFARVLRPGGRLAAATNGAGNMAELDDLAAAIGRPDLLAGAMMNDFTAEAGPAYLSRHFDRVTVQRYEGDLAVPAVEPVVAYLESLAGVPLTPAQRAAAGDRVQAAIDADGHFHVRKDTVLITAVR